MNVGDREVSLARTARNALKRELTSAGQLRKLQVLRRGTDEDQVVIVGIIEGEEAASFDAQVMVQVTEDLIEFVDRQYFAHPSVVVPNLRFGIARGIEVAHAGF